MDYKKFFKGKKVTVLGLGLLGKQLKATEFMAKCGADIVITDLKSKQELRSSVLILKKYKNIQFVLGEHRLQDFENRDFILKGQGTPLDSIYIAHARKNNIPIRMDDELFLSLAPQTIKTIGITGTRGKTTVTMLIYHILKKAGIRVHLGGNIQGTAMLPLLSKIKSNDTIVMELSSWQLQGFGESKISPHIAVFTNIMPDHMNYYKNSMAKYFTDKSYIYKNQTKKDFLVIGEKLKSKIKNPSAKVIVSALGAIPGDWKTYLRGAHNAHNIACAIEACRAYGIKELDIKKGLETFKGVSGRLEFIRIYNGVSIYNDTCATTPEALGVGLAALAPHNQQNKLILIAGGTTKTLKLGLLPKIIKKYTKDIILLPGTGTDELVKTITKENFSTVKTLKEAVKEACSRACPGDIILFSPGFASFGMFKNEYDRGEQFNRIVKGLR